MLFTSPEFLFVFLPVSISAVVLVMYTRIPAAFYIVLVAASLVFYGWWRVEFLILLIGSITVNFLLGNFLGKRPDKSVLIFAITLNLCLLGYFKYVDFFVRGLNDLFGSSISAGNIVLPLAISFFTFQQIAYLVDVYRQKVSERSFVEYFLFVTFFPQLIAGPIVHHAEVIPQFKERPFLRLSSQDLLIGLAIFSIGLYKKIVCADGIGIVADNLFDNVNADISLFDAWAGTLAYSLQIYFDFSGYSDMAMGLARIFGIRLPINFYSPYKSASIIEFWRTWHITLSRFLRDYLYIPLGGNRLGPFVRYRNLMIVMLLGGLWHGAGWNFVAWGGLHGAFLIINHGARYLGGQVKMGTSRANRVIKGLSIFLTFFSVTCAWVVFRAENMTEAAQIYKALFGFTPFILPESLAYFFPRLGSMIEAPVTYLPLTDGGAFLWILLLLAVVWFAPTPYELFSESRPCLDANRLEKLGGPHLQSPILSQTKKLLTLIDCRDIISSAGLKLTLIAVLGGTCALIVLVRGTQTPAFIYMFF